MRKFNLATIALCALVLAACATTLSFDQQVAAAQQTNTAVVTAAADAVTLGTLSPADGAKVAALADQAEALIASAKALSATDPAGAQGKLLLAAGILTELQKYVTPKVKP